MNSSFVFPTDEDWYELDSLVTSLEWLFASLKPSYF